MTPLFWSVTNGHTAMVIFLLEAGANLDARTKKGKTLLHCAASVSGEEADIVDVLIKRGVDLYAQDKFISYITEFLEKETLLLIFASERATTLFLKRSRTKLDGGA
eukprot:gene38979-52652_t